MNAPAYSPFDLLMQHIIAMRDMAEKYAEESAADGDTDQACENMRVFSVLKELHRLGSSFAKENAQAQRPADNNEPKTPHV